MTKRFTGEFDKQYSGVHDNGEQLTNFEVVDLLNDLSEDNEYLEKRFKEEEWHYNHIDEDRDVWMYKCQELEKENEQLKASLYAEKTNTAEVVNDYSKQFKRHSAQFSFMMDLADDLGVDISTLEALDD